MLIRREILQKREKKLIHKGGNVIKKEKKFQIWGKTLEWKKKEKDYVSDNNIK